MSEDLKDETEVEKPSLDTIIESWLEKHGEEKSTKAGVPYLKINSQDYKEALSSLLNSILYAGYDESDARSESLLKKIHEALTAEITDSKKLKAWKDIVTQVWKFVVAKQFANKDLIKPATNYTAETKDKLDGTPYTPPKSKLDPDKFEGYGDAEVIYDDEVAKMFEDLKKDE